MVTLFPWQQQSSKLKAQIFCSFSSAWESPLFRNLKNLTDFVLFYILFQECNLGNSKMYRIFTELWATEFHHH